MTYRDLSSYLSWFYRYFFLAIAHEHPNSCIHKVDKRQQSLYLISLPYLCTLLVNSYCCDGPNDHRANLPDRSHDTCSIDIKSFTTITNLLVNSLTHAISS
eukprot:238392_1